MTKLSTSNYSFKSLCLKNKNEQFLNRFTLVDDRKLDLYFKLAINFEQLNFQANTFAVNLRGHGEYNFAKILRCRETDIERKLYELYIYSYVKNVHNSFFYYNLNEESNLGYAFIGHAKLFHLMKQSSLFRIEGDVSVNIVIQNEDNNKKQLVMALLVTQFPFLSEYFGFLDCLGLQPLIIPEFENIFSNLLYDWYASRANEEQAMQKTVKSKNILKQKGNLEIVQCNDIAAVDVTKPDSYPVANAFLNEDETKLHYIPVNTKYPLENNSSFFFSKANQLRLVSSSASSNLEQRYYHTLDINKNHDFFVCSEVYTNTGIKCSYFSQAKGENFSYFPIPGINSGEMFDEFKRLYSNYNSIKDILNAIAEEVKRRSTQGK